MRHVVSHEGASAFPVGDAPERVAEHIWRLPLPLPFALRIVNVYLIDDGPGKRTLIDAGLGLPADEAALRAGLDHAGVALEDISTLVLTHAHPDHIGLSGMIHEASGAPVLMLEHEDEVLYRVWAQEDAPQFTQLEAMYAANGFPPDLLEAANAGTRRTRRIPRLAPHAVVRTLKDGEDVRLGEATYRAIWTPGHSDYHLCLLREDGLFIAGDHILPSITPNIGYYPHGRPDPLHDYFLGLARVRDLPARLVLPGHGRVFTALAARVDALRAHHEERSARVRALLGAQPAGADAGTIARDLFGPRLRTADDWRFGLVETLAHLEYLRNQQLVTRHEESGSITYRLSTGSADSAA